MRSSQVLPPSYLSRRRNRLATHEKSWHSVNPVLHDVNRRCVSNYYFSAETSRTHDYFHVNLFSWSTRGTRQRPILRADIALRMGLRKVFKKGVKENLHVYKRPVEPKS
jgi:hypothetical protein